MFRIYNETEYAQQLEKVGFYAYFNEQSEIYSSSYDYWDCVMDEDGDCEMRNSRATRYCVSGYTEIGVLIRYYLSQGMKKKQVKEAVIKCWKNYDDFVDFRYLDKAVDRTLRRVYKTKEPIVMRNIDKLYVNKKVLQWFINLPKEDVLTDEELEKIKADIERNSHHVRNEGGSLRDLEETQKNRNMNTLPYIRKNLYCWNRAKYLWTMYVWYLLQKEAGYAHPERIYMKGSYKKFKMDANLPTHFNYNKETTLMCWAGAIDEHISWTKTGQNYLELKFLDKIKEIEESSDGEAQQATLGEMVEFRGPDMYACGEYLEHMRDYKRPTICPYCGRTFDKKSNRPNEGCKDEYCIRKREREKKRAQRAAKKEAQNDNM